MAGISIINNRLIVRNTIVLYIRTFFIMILALYTSRLVLNQLGVEDFGIYNVVGGLIAMFSVISTVFSSSISRYITFELGKKEYGRLRLIFSTSVNIQIIIALFVFILGEIFGGWFLNKEMTIPVERLNAANWVLHISLISFCFNIISVPYNACIIAHEHMSAYAYITTLDAALKLGICFLLSWGTIDRLVFYALLMLIVTIFIRIVYGIYCRKHFEECEYEFKIDRKLSVEMLKFTGMNFFINTAYVFNIQGVNMLVNIFFGVTLNAARGIATQVEAAVVQFVNSFTTALNPQITKNYAVGDYEYMYKLICQGAKFSYFLLYLLALPILFETDFILVKWLKVVPDYATLFVRLSIVGALVTVIGNTAYTACMATGNIKKYTIWVSLIGFCGFPITWLCYLLEYPPQSAYIVYIIVYAILDIVKLIQMRYLLKISILYFVKEVFCPIIIVTVIGVSIPMLLYYIIEPSTLRFFIISFICIVSVAFAIIFFGLTLDERIAIKTTINNKIHKK